ncbi:LacI family DNA-binding transcriptional regulator [Actinotalea sp. K2]|uniref:LacI family DNA-binding transcriptional regulator n=1 Tax=Actinotalea sp. K2 TaxID=2939438 RepID=UPI002017ECEB|nr:LacI family DNA-binding transcriptional regulator [Actinotalea sp. K2]MCL3862141.1 LacI family transcriptional regulator [Actinotalea sp. K2]
MSDSSTRRPAVGVRDVAALARVSPTTVSNALSGNRPVSSSTRERVVWAVEQLGYRPNISAQNLRGRRTGLIGVAVPEIDVPYFAELIRHVVDASRQRGYTVLIDQTEGRLEAERFVLNGMNPGMVDGILFSPLSVDRTECETRRDRTPLVLLGERVSGHGVDHVAIDNVAAAADATNHLIRRGCHRIAAIGYQESHGGGTAPQRTQGYRTALRAADLTFDPVLVRHTDRYHRRDGEQAMMELLDSSGDPDAVFCYSDLLALGAIHALHDRGLRVPEDVAVIGIDDIDEGRYSTPTLTTVAPDKVAIANAAVELLFDQIAGTAQAPRQVVAPHTVEVRRSA